MSKPKLTPWFPGHIKPVRPGVYERMGMFGHLSPTGMSMWDSTHGWSRSRLTARQAVNEEPGGSLYQPDDEANGSEFQWRGLAEQPK